MLHVYYSPRPSKRDKETTLKDVLENLKSHFVEVSTFTTADNKMSIHIGDVPPINCALPTFDLGGKHRGEQKGCLLEKKRRSRRFVVKRIPTALASKN